MSGGEGFLHDNDDDTYMTPKGRLALPRGLKNSNCRTQDMRISEFSYLLCGWLGLLGPGAVGAVTVHGDRGRGGCRLQVQRRVQQTRQLCRLVNRRQQQLTRLLLPLQLRRDLNRTPIRFNSFVVFFFLPPLRPCSHRIQKHALRSTQWKLIYCVPCHSSLFRVMSKTKRLGTLVFQLCSM